MQVITEEVYRILEAEGGLERREEVLAESRNGPRSFVFVSPGFQEKERLQGKATERLKGNTKGNAKGKGQRKG